MICLVFAPALPFEEMQLELELLTDTGPPEPVTIEEIPDSPGPQPDPPAMSELPTKADQESERKVKAPVKNF